MSARALAALLDDPRSAVRERAVDALALHAGVTVTALRRTINGASSPTARRNAVWAASRIDSPQAMTVVRDALHDKDLGVLLAAIHSVGVHRDVQATAAVLPLVTSGQLSVRREAATALGRIGSRAETTT